MSFKGISDKQISDDLKKIISDRVNPRIIELRKRGYSISLGEERIPGIFPRGRLYNTIIDSIEISKTEVTKL